MGELTDKAKGKAKEVAGAAKGDERLEAEGKKDRLKGEVKEGVEDVKHDIREAIHRPEKK